MCGGRESGLCPETGRSPALLGKYFPGVVGCCVYDCVDPLVWLAVVYMTVWTPGVVGCCIYDCVDPLFDH